MTETRLIDLGLPRRRIGPPLNLKAAVRLAAGDDAPLRPLAAALPYSGTLLAASTHAGEEIVVLDAFARMRRADPRLRLILAPRHPQRGDEVAALVRAAGLTLAQRSKDQAPTPDTAVYLADTLGEMASWYRLAAVTFVGGSLVPKGGHTPFEPAQFSSAILHGPDVANQSDAYRALADAEAAVEIDDAASLAAAARRLLADRDGRRAMAARATAALAALGSGSAGIDAFAARVGDLAGIPANGAAR